MANIKKANEGRLNIALDKQYNFTVGGIMTMRQWIDNKLNSPEGLVLSESDAMIDWSRIKFNRMDYKEQAAYEAGLKAKRYYWINHTKVAKMVYDHALTLSPFLCGDNARFATREVALDHASKVFKETGKIISVEFNCWIDN